MKTSRRSVRVSALNRAPWLMLCGLCWTLLCGPPLRAMRGDFDGDERWTARDAEAALQMSVGARVVDLNLDVDDDAQVTSSDARIILQGTARKQRREGPARQVVASTPPPRQVPAAPRPAAPPSPPPQPPTPKVTAPLHDPHDPPATVAAKTTQPLNDPPPPSKPAAPPAPPRPSEPFYATCLMYEARNFDQITGQSTDTRLKLPQVRDRLRSVDVNQIQWKPGDQPLLLHASAGALGKYHADFFKPGHQLSGPAQLAITGERATTMTGAVLLECREVFRSRNEVLAKYPGALVDSLPKGGSIDSAQGKMIAIPAAGGDGVFQIDVMSDQTGSMTLKFGPLQQGWSDDAKRQSLELTAQFKAFCAGELAWLGMERKAQLLALRRFRDEVLTGSAGGREFIRFYYDDFSPWAKRVMCERPDTRPAFRAIFDIAATLVNHDASAAPRLAVTDQRAE